MQPNADFNPNLTQAELIGMVGQYEVEKRVWQREYQKLVARVSELEVELASLTGGQQNDVHAEAVT